MYVHFLKLLNVHNSPQHWISGVEGDRYHTHCDKWPEPKQLSDRNHLRDRYITCTHMHERTYAQAYRAAIMRTANANLKKHIIKNGLPTRLALAKACLYKAWSCEEIKLAKECRKFVWVIHFRANKNLKAEGLDNVNYIPGIIAHYRMQ